MSRGPALEVTAYHEAGHAIAAWRQRIAISSVTIKPGEDYSGRLLFGRSRTPNLDEATDRARLWSERRIITALAGPIAQRKYRPSSVRGWHAREDYHVAADLALHIQGSGKLATAYLRWLNVSTEALVSANWTHIEAVAAALLEGRTIAGKDVLAVLLAAHNARHPPARGAWSIRPLL